MQDDMEKFIGEHRAEFDAHEPDADAWLSINKKLGQKNHSMRIRYYVAAASILLLVGVFIGFMQVGREKKVVPGNSEVIITPEIKQAEVYDASIVETKRTQLSQFCKAYPDVCEDFDHEIDTLHLQYGQLKTEYQNSNGNELVIKAMLENLQTQVQLLNKQIQVIQEIKQQESKQHQHLKMM